MVNTVNITLSMLNIISTLKVWTWSKPKFSLKSYCKISGTRPGPSVATCGNFWYWPSDTHLPAANNYWGNDIEVYVLSDTHCYNNTSAAQHGYGGLSFPLCWKGTMKHTSQNPNNTRKLKQPSTQKMVSRKGGTQRIRLTVVTVNCSWHGAALISWAIGSVQPGRKFARGRAPF